MPVETTLAVDVLKDVTTFVEDVTPPLLVDTTQVVDLLEDAGAIVDDGAKAMVVNTILEGVDVREKEEER